MRLKDNTPKSIVSVVSAKSGVSYRDFTNTEIVEFNQNLMLCSLDCGIKEPLDQLELQRLNELVATQFPDFTTEELTLSFNLYAAKKLDFDQGVYQSFDKLFFGNVLASYKRYKMRELAKLKQHEIEESKKDFEAEYLLIINNEIDRYIEKLKYCEYGTSHLKDEYGLMYDFLIKRKLMSPSAEEKTEQYNIEVENIIERGLTADQMHLRKDFKDLKEGKPSEKNKFHRNAIRAAKLSVLKTWIEESIMEDVNFRELLEPLKK